MLRSTMSYNIISLNPAKTRKHIMHGRVSLSPSPSLSLPTVTVVEKVAHHDPCSPPEALSHVSLAAEKRVCIIVILLSLNKSNKEEKRDKVSIIKEFSRQWYNNRPSNCIYMYMCMAYSITMFLGTWKSLNHSQGNIGASSKYYRLVGSVATTHSLPPSLEQSTH